MSDAIPHSLASGGSAPKRRPPRVPDLRALWTHWREDYAVNGRSLWKPGFIAVATYRFGVWVDGIGPRLLRGPLRRLYFLMFGLVRSLFGIEIYYSVRAGRRLRIGHQSGIVLHPRSVLGDDCLLRQGVTIGVARSGAREVPVLGDRVEIGAGAVVVGPVRIGDDVLIGPNVVVRESVPSGSRVMPPEPEIRPRSLPVPD